jgi:hypothetical protein
MQATIMKVDAQADYDVVKSICKAKGLPAISPKGDSAWNIEDATAEMIKSLPVDQQIYLRKGLSYYVSLIRSNNK